VLVLNVISVPAATALEAVAELELPAAAPVVTLSSPAPAVQVGVVVDPATA
jgi:hypothetical protein